MRRKTAKELLAESFRQLAEKKSIDRITIREIAENSGYSQATFYRQFHDKYDLIAWDYTRRLEEIMSQITGDAYSWQKALHDAAEYFHAQKKYLANLFLHTSGLDSFISYMREINFRTLKQTVLRITGSEETDEQITMYIRIYVLGTVQLTCEWILGQYHVSPEQLAEIYDRALPEPIAPYLRRV